MADEAHNKDYVLHSDEECIRLERQFKLYGFEDDRRHLSLSPTDEVLDVGCGSGAITREIASAVPNGKAIGVDRESRYINFARHKAASENIKNIRFAVGDVLKLPFENDSFDIVWSKHLLQFIRERNLALTEFRRVIRPGGRVVCCNYDGIGTYFDPVDAEIQHAMDRWWAAAKRELGIDNLIGRKLPSMFLKAGFGDVKFDIIPDRGGGFGGDPERTWNFEAQLKSILEFSARVYGSMERAKFIHERFLELFSSPNVYHHCTLFYVEGRKP